MTLYFNPRLHLRTLFAFICLSISPQVLAGEEHDHAESQPDIAVKLSQTQQQLVGIKIATVSRRPAAMRLAAPAELLANGYTSYIATPRTESIVVKRHVMLGDIVKPGQALATLFSPTMAEAQAEYISAYTDWLRVKTLTSNTVSQSEKQLLAIKQRGAEGKLLALGLSADAIRTLREEPEPTLGQYTLNAQTAGIVLQDAFVLGQRIAAGDALMLISNEQSLWVDARIPASNQLTLDGDTSAFVVWQAERLPAKVIQQAHTIDPITRTRIVRLQVDNPADVLHAGMFVDVEFMIPTKTDALVVPTEALSRSSDGDWQVFVTSDDETFVPVEVELGTTLAEGKEVLDLPEGSRIAISGAFFIASELAKSGFDPHNH
ncbi:efflux RND transporter periplasmic adaptor subunit [Pseudoalteromonas fenneropenaei]|uniref:Efflux RND transporter periplasmic adaptor subunit n=1 Tax=Pseudoalteromonas fenneropenaei TaxID=1737459 RepID=A0ABV7CQ12_9GAMM